MQNMGDPVCEVRRTEDEVHTSGCGAAVSRKRQRLKKRQYFLVREGIYWLLKKVMKATDTKETGS